jgi:hypothetical protein
VVHVGLLEYTNPFKFQMGLDLFFLNQVTKRLSKEAKHLSITYLGLGRVGRKKGTID